MPYMGSKQAIADQIIKIFPPADNFYDLFGGGFSITHAMLARRSKDFQRFHFNEIKSDIVLLIQRAIAGEFSYEKFQPPFIDREQFFKNLDDPYVRCTWSFGNNQKSYLFSQEIEPYKKSMHNAIVFNKFDELAKKVFSHDGFKDGYSIHQRRLFLRTRIEFFRLHGIPDFLMPFFNEKQLQQLQQLEQLERLQQLEQLQQLERLEQLQQLERLLRLQQLQQLERLERLQQLQQLERLERLRFSSKSYDQIVIEPRSIVYCDPPYKETEDYGNSFNTAKFLDWADAQEVPVFISEYNIDDTRFKVVKRIRKASSLNNSKDKKTFKEERVYLNRAGVLAFEEG